MAQVGTKLLHKIPGPVKILKVRFLRSSMLRRHPQCISHLQKISLPIPQSAHHWHNHFYIAKSLCTNHWRVCKPALKVLQLADLILKCYTLLAPR